MLLAYGEAALKSGAFDLPSEEDSFRLPKNVLTAACADVSEQWSPPLTSDSKRQVKNIRACSYPDYTAR